MHYEVKLPTGSYFIDCFIPDYKISIIFEKGEKNQENIKLVEEQFKYTSLKFSSDDPKFCMFKMIGIVFKAIAIKSYLVKKYNTDDFIVDDHDDDDNNDKHKANSNEATPPVANASDDMADNALVISNDVGRRR